MQTHSLRGVRRRTPWYILLLHRTIGFRRLIGSRLQVINMQFAGPITAAEIERFYSAKMIQTACPVCGKAEWKLADQPSAVDVYALSSVNQAGNTIVPPPSAPVVVVFCAHCFHLRLHSEVLLRDWLGKNPAPIQGLLGSVIR